MVDRINELLAEDLPSDRFVTFVVAILDPGANRVRLISAGHGPLFIYTAADGRVQDFNAHNIPFGIASDVRYGPPQEIELAPGDMLVLITDGFFEWADSAGEIYGTARLSEAIRAASSLPPDRIIKRLHSAVLDFAGGTVQADDLTAVIVKRKSDARPTGYSL